MNVFYEKAGGSVFVTDSKANRRVVSNVDNIEELLLLENEKELINDLLDNALELYDSEMHYCKFQYGIATMEFIFDAIMASAYAALIIDSPLPQLGVAAYFLHGLGLLNLPQTRFGRISDAKKAKKDVGQVVKNLKIFKDVVDEEMTLEKEKSKKISDVCDAVVLMNKSLIDNNILGDFSNRNDIFKNYYNLSGYVNVPSYDDRNNRIITGMIKRQLELENDKPKTKRIK